MSFFSMSFLFFHPTRSLFSHALLRAPESFGRRLSLDYKYHAFVTSAAAGPYPSFLWELCSCLEAFWFEAPKRFSLIFNSVFRLDYPPQTSGTFFRFVTSASAKNLDVSS